MILECKNVTKRYIVKRTIFGSIARSIDAVHDVSLCVREGESLGVVGESGSGKSTLARLIVGLTPVTEGSIVFRDKCITGQPGQNLRALRREIQIIFQDPYASLNPAMTIGEIIAEPLTNYKVTSHSALRSRVEELLVLVGLDRSYASRKPHEFSGGQRQRISIARSIGLNPKLLICDEATSALDVSIQAQIINLLIRLRSQLNMTYIFISHDLSVVQRVCDRILVMKDGETVEIGGAYEIINDPREVYTRELIESAKIHDIIL